MDYLRLSKIMKAIADPNRLQILDMISTGEKCACDILDDFQFTQPTLSHHMKVLIEAGIVTARKEGKWHYYSLVTENVEEFQKLTNQIFKMNLKEGAM
ncbi:MAG: metalloregulator ArsR/SmtB family transcription factor [Tetragenococcus halophilus]|uniref:ArsR family transcriptional regulator n=1 Tax=Tetragenococcus halophilus TaxID=51669 RepID=A0A3G5FI20_TETHA|nr:MULTISPECIES: metalloregulator ArsR/SmtB family transcription factor [Tetragenococcus]AYW49931.1 ArsR family transcriptional regulator [Tetragenococcus halophilus]MCF1627415.1 metalloregulator ArsR/SmtB family transcription factor [Tetragenococcus koreensis]MCO8288693.1 winged helix-turn-helix transcriptional regulator [Tetragenococcus halophilus]MCO8288700.1 winged helix-turn-helix transcriptional regulator [Tetragenococcus halophilus]MDN6112262.1 metalloregulator ArsR/SmtB family transcri